MSQPTMVHARGWHVVLAVGFAILVLAGPARAFSVLAHQGVVDAAWESSIVPAIKGRFPSVGVQDLERAREFAYGGSHIADIGYFPFGSRLFTDLLHYVRSGDFVANILVDASTPDELAFALGALAHWRADSIGHAEATNRAVAEIYPDLRQKYGDWITYEEDHRSHSQTEFRFDILQLARNHQSPDLFQQAMKFEVDEKLLDRAFHETYGVGLDDLFGSTKVAITTYRWGFRELLQEATGIAWQLYQGDIKQIDPSTTADRFVFEMPRKDFEREFGKSYREAGYGAKFFSFVTTIVPDWGPLGRLPFKALPPPVRQQFGEAFDHVVTFYRADVDALRTHKTPRLQNITLDTGAPTRGGEYKLADDAYAELLKKLAEHDFAGVTPALRNDLVRFFDERNTWRPPDPDDHDAFEQRAALQRLRATVPGDGDVVAAGSAAAAYHR